MDNNLLDTLYMDTLFSCFPRTFNPAYLSYRYLKRPQTLVLQIDGLERCSAK